MRTSILFGTVTSFALFGIVALSACGEDAPDAPSIEPDASSASDVATGPLLPPFPDRGVMLGAFVNQGTSTPSEVAAQLGRPLALEVNYVGWGEDFATVKKGWLGATLARGAVPELSWQLDDTPNCTGVHFDDILAGTQDGVIEAAAAAIRAVAPSWVVLRPFWEMNGAWYCTNEKHQSTKGTCDGTAKYVAAWRRIHDVFAQQGVTNVRWVWAPSHQDLGQPECNHWSLYYPGDAYVDVVGVDGYNKFRQTDAGGPDSDQPWTDFAPIFQPLYDAYPQKPFMVAETASAEDPSTPGRKSAWIDAAHAYIAASMPRLKAFVWFIKGRVNGDPDDYSLCTSQPAFDAFARMAEDPYFGGTSAPPAFVCK